MKLFTNFLDLAVLEMNLKKYTKADLISKVENLQNKMNSKSTRTNSKFLINQIKVYFSQVWDLILTFKNLLFKLTLISLIIKYFKKIKLIRKIWIIINTIVMGIFGISIFENSLFDFFSNIIYEIRFISGNIIDYLTNTNFYKYLNNLFSNNKIIENKDIIENKEIINNKNKLVNKNENDLNEYTKKIKTENQKWKNKLLEDTKSKLANWINPVKEVIEQPDIESNYKKYLYLTAIIITTSLTWYYSDEIKTNFTALMEWLMSFRTGPGDGTGNDSNNSSTHIETNFQSKLEKSTVSEKIELIDLSNKGKTIDISNLSESEIERRGFTSPSLDDLNKNVTEDWKIRSMSPSSSSTSSTETITPSSFTSFNIDNEKMSSISGLKQLTELVQELDPQKVSEKMEWIENNLKDIDNNEIKNKIIESFKDIQFINDEFNSKFDIIKSKGLLNDNFKLNQIEFQNKKIQNWIEKYSDEIND
jgi:hypothetical protein